MAHVGERILDPCALPVVAILSPLHDAGFYKPGEAAAECGHLPEDSKKRANCIVIVEEVPAGNWTFGGHDLSRMPVSFVATVLSPKLSENASLLACFPTAPPPLSCRRSLQPMSRIPTAPLISPTRLGSRPMPRAMR